MRYALLMNCRAAGWSWVELGRLAFIRWLYETGRLGR